MTVETNAEHNNSATFAVAITFYAISGLSICGSGKITTYDFDVLGATFRFGYHMASKNWLLHFEWYILKGPKIIQFRIILIDGSYCDRNKLLKFRRKNTMKLLNWSKSAGQMNFWVKAESTPVILNRFEKHVSQSTFSMVYFRPLLFSGRKPINGSAWPTLLMSLSVTLTINYTQYRGITNQWHFLRMHNNHHLS